MLRRGGTKKIARLLLPHGCDERPILSMFIPIVVWIMCIFYSSDVYFHQTYIFIRHTFWEGDTDVLPTNNSQVGVGAGWREYKFSFDK